MLKELSDKAIHKLIDHWNPLPSRLDGIAPTTIKLKLFQAVARKAEQEILRQVLEWGEEDCPHPTTMYGGYPCSKRECKKCWQELKREASPNSEPLSSPQQAEGYPAEVE